MGKPIEISSTYTVDNDTILSDGRFESHIRNNLALELAYEIAKSMVVKTEPIAVEDGGELTHTKYSTKIYVNYTKEG